MLVSLEKTSNNCPPRLSCGWFWCGFGVVWFGAGVTEAVLESRCVWRLVKGMNTFPTARPLQWKVRDYRLAANDRRGFALF